MDALQQSARPATSPEPERPRVLDAALALVVLAAVVNVGIGAAVAVVAFGTPLPPKTSAGLFAVATTALVAISVVYAAGLVVLALLLRSGRTWARAALVTLSSLSLLTVFALNAYNLAVIVLLLAAGLLLYRPVVSTWVRARRGVAPA